MFKYLGTKIFGTKKEEKQKPTKHRLTISIPSTKYDPPQSAKSKLSSKITTSLSSITPPPSNSPLERSSSSKSAKSSKSTKSRHHKSKSSVPVGTQILSKKSSNTKSNAAVQSSSNSTRPIFQQSAVYQSNSGLKFEITIQYQGNMWTVYKSLCDFIELHGKIKAKYAHIPIPGPLKQPSIDSDHREHQYNRSNHSKPKKKNPITQSQSHVEVPPLLPLGLFYLYFQEPRSPTNRSKTNKDSLTSSKSASATQKSSSSRSQRSRYRPKHSPKSVYRQIYQYHQQQIMAQKRQEAQMVKQMKQIDHIRQLQHQQQLQLQEKQMQQFHADSNGQIDPNPKTTMPPMIPSSSAPLQKLDDYPSASTASTSSNTPNTPITPLSTKSVPPPPITPNGFQFPPSSPQHRFNKSIFDSESPFLKHMRVSLQIWLRVLVDDPILVTSTELSHFIQFRWVYANKSKSDGSHHSNNKSTLHPLLNQHRRIVGGHHAPDQNMHSEFTKNGKIRHLSAPHYNALNNMQDHGSSDDTELHRPTLSDFTLLKVVGKGAFGKVLQVRRANDTKIYAMKILKKENVIKRNQIEHTKTERRVLGYVNHPFIVSLYYSFQTETKLFLVLDYCGGGELFFHLGKAGRFKEDRARFYAASIALALEYLHSKDIIYRDLKPENVLLDAEGHIKITDFGLSKENINETELAHSFCGTPEYLAPEILRRCGHGKPADWWSLGALLYEMLTGMPPFYSRDRDRLFEKILHAKLRFPNYFSDAAVNILTLLMQRNWKKRLGSYQSSNPEKYKNDPKRKSFAELKGAQQIKRHVFFKEIDWTLLYERRLKPPFTPKLNEDQTNNFDAEFTEMPIYSMDNTERSSRYINREKRKYLLKFESFTYVRDESLLETASEYEGTDTADGEEEEEEEEEEEDSSSDFEDDSDNAPDEGGLQGDSEDAASDQKSESKTPEGEVICIGGAKLRDVQNGRKVVSNNPTDKVETDDSEQSDLGKPKLIINANANGTDEIAGDEREDGNESGFEVFD